MGRRLATQAFGFCVTEYVSLAGKPWRADRFRGTGQRQCRAVRQLRKALAPMLTISRISLCATLAAPAQVVGKLHARRGCKRGRRLIGLAQLRH